MFDVWVCPIYIYMNVYAIRLQSTGWIGGCGWVLSCLFCFIVGYLYNGSRDGTLLLNNFIP